MDMKSEMEQWALCRAQEIVVREGFMLVDAAQALDKKRTRTGVHRLQQAIGKAILLAMEEFSGASGGLEKNLDTKFRAGGDNRDPRVYSGTMAQ